MVSLTSVFQSHSNILFTNKTLFQTASPYHSSLSILGHDKHSLPKGGSIGFGYTRRVMPMRTANVVVSAAVPEENKKPNGLVDELRSAAMRLQSKEYAKAGEKKVEQTQERKLAEWEPTLDGSLKFLVDSKLVFDTLEGIKKDPAFPYVEFRNTGLERSEKLAKDLKWIKDQGHDLPEPTDFGVNYAIYLKQLSDKDSQAFLCHFYNLYFGHAAGGRILGKRLAEKIFNDKDLEFFNWPRDVSKLLQNVGDNLNKVTERWTKEEKSRCLGETEISFTYYGDIISLILL